MKRTILIVGLLLASTALAAVRTVPGDYPTIQAAIDDCNQGDTVIVDPNTYIEDISFPGINITLRSVDPNFLENTIIQGTGTGSVVTFTGEEDPNCVLSGFTITGGNASDGGGIYCGTVDDYGNPTIKNCIIKENIADEGGGIYCRSSANISNCTIVNNIANDRGGGIYCDRDINTYDCTIINNTAFEGGGVYSYGDGRLSSTRIIGNQATNGAGVYAVYYGLEIMSCEFVGNSASNNGGALCEINLIRNSSIVANTAGNSGGGVYSPDGLIAHNCIFWANTDISGLTESAHIFSGEPYVIYSCIQDDDPNDVNIPFGGDANSNTDDYPMFTKDPNDGGDGWGLGGNDDFGDLHLLKTSPCIEAGMPDYIIGQNATDIDGQPRIMGLNIDIGADEFPIPVLAVTKPLAGQVWISGSLHKIEWHSYGAGFVDILFSDNSGAGWQSIDSNVTDNGDYLWHLCDIVDSNQCMVKVVPTVADPNVICIESGIFTIHPDNPDPTVQARWQTLGGDFRRSGLSETFGPQIGCVKWQFETDSPVSTSAAVGLDGRVHLGCEDGRLYTLDVDGSLLWSYDVNSPILSSPTIGPDGTVYFASEDGRLYAISMDGNLRWTHEFGSVICSSPAVSASGQVYACSQQGSVYALGPDGSELWNFEIKGSSQLRVGGFASAAIGADGSIYVAGLYDPNLYALDPNDGSIKWKCLFEKPVDPNDRGARTGLGRVFASPVVAEDGTIYQTLLLDTNLYAIEPNGGTILWSTDLGDPCSGWFDSNYIQDYETAGGWSEPVLGPDGTIYVSFDDPYLRAVDPNGSIKWVSRLGIVGGFTLTAGEDGLIYAASDDGYLCVVNADGQEVSRFESNDWLTYPVIAGDNVVIVSDAKDNSGIISDANNTVWAIWRNDCEGEESVLHRLGDLDTNWGVDFVDFAVLAGKWLSLIDMSQYAVELTFDKGDIDRDLDVDFADAAVMAEQWLIEE